MSPGALLSVEQSEHGELIETKRSRSMSSKWKLLSTVISITKSLWHGVKPQIYIELERSSFEVNASVLAKVNKNPGLIEDEYGGMECFANALGTDLGSGLTRDVTNQREKYGSNGSKNPKKSWFCLARKAILDRNILITAACGMVILVVGIPAKGFSEVATDAGSILIAIVIAAFMMFMNEWRSNKLQVSLHDVVDTVKISVLRAGLNQQVLVSDIVVGDVILLKSGDRVPGHGFLIEQHSLKLDLPMDYSMNQQFLLSGTVVVAGFGRMLVTAVGVNESRRSSGRDENLQSQLEAVDSLIQILGYLVTALFFVLIYPLNLTTTFTYNEERGTKASLQGIGKAYAIIETVVWIILIIISIPNPWELSLMLTKAYATRKLKAGKNAKVFDASALESMSYATVICTDKTGVIATNLIKVSKFWQPYQGFVGKETIDLRVKELVRKGIALNSSETLGRSTENAILCWAVEDLNTDVERIKKSHNVTYGPGLDSCSSILASEIEDGAKHVHSRGSPRQVLSRCSSYYDYLGTTKSLDDDQMRSRFEEMIRDMEESGLMCVAFAHRQVREGEVEMDNLKDLILIGVIVVSNPCREGVKTAVIDCRTAGVKLKLITEDNLLTAKAMAIECGILGEDGEEQVIEGTEFRNYSEKERIEKVDSIGVIANASPWDKHLMIQSLKRKGHVVAIAGELPTSEDADITVSMEIQGAFGADIVILDDNFASVVRVLEWGRCFYRSIQKFLQFQLIDKIVTLIVSFTTNFPLTTAQLLWLSVFTDTLAAIAFATLKPTKDILESQPAILESQQVELAPEEAILESHPVEAAPEAAILESQPEEEASEAAILEISQPVEAAPEAAILESQPVQVAPEAATMESQLVEAAPEVAILEISQPVEADLVRYPLVTNAMLRNVLLQSLYQLAVLIYFMKTTRETFLFNLFVLFRVFSALSSRELGAARIFRRLHRNGQFWVIIGVSVALQALFVENLPKVFHTEQLSWSEWGKCVAIVFVTLPIGWVVRFIPVPKKHIFGHCKKILDLKSRIETTILSKLRSLLTWPLVLIGVRKREQPRGDTNV